jgi:F-type H+-transporting ATPase subunit delta
MADAHKAPYVWEPSDVANDDPILASMAGRYATALFDLAKDQNQLDAVDAQLDIFLSMLDESEDLRNMVKSPVFSADDQFKAINALVDKAGIDGIVANFLKLIAKNRRLFAAADMVRAFKGLLARERGEVSAEVISAQALNDNQMSALRVSLKASVGKDVKITAKVDPSLLGGLTVKMGSKMIDSSLRTKLNKLKVAMKEVS